MTTAKKIRTTCSVLAELLVRKNADYGDSFRNPCVFIPDVSIEDALLIRMSDKVTRIANLRLMGSTQSANESLLDSYRDLAGYCILMIILLQESEAGK